MADSPLTAICAELKEVLSHFEKGSVAARVNLPGRYDLYSEQKVILNGRPRADMYFASVIMQKNYVGFYFMPVYTHPEVIRPQLHPDLLKRLKGKSCFHITSLNADMKMHIRQALETGYQLYCNNEWIS